MVGDRLVVDGLVVADDCAVRLVAERIEAGEDPSEVVRDAIEIGSRVLDREQAAANAEFVRNEFEKVAAQVESSFGLRAVEAGEAFGKKVDEVFGADSGVVTKILTKHFSDESSVAVQNQVRAAVTEVMNKSREELLRQFSSADGQNPLADFKAAAVGVIKQGHEQQHQTMLKVTGELAKVQRELQALRDERDKLKEVAAERERGTAKGREFEEVVFEALDEIAAAQGDDATAVGDLADSVGRKGDIVADIGACTGPARGRIVFEAKDSRISKPEAIRQLDGALVDRSADFAVLVVPSDDELPAKMRSLREYNGDKLVVVWDPEAGSDVSLELAYSLARARVLMAKADSEGIDAAAVHDTVERALQAMEEVRKVKSSLTGAKTQIDRAGTLVEAMSDRVRDHLRAIDELVLAASEELAEAVAGRPEQEQTELY